MATPVPQPPGLPLLGNVMDIDPVNAVRSLMHLADKYGPIYKLSILGRERYFVSSAALVNELCDEKRFVKDTSGPLDQLRPGIGDGLFTAHHGEHAWEVAHRTLVPAFGPFGIRDMFDEMYDIAGQLIAKWARLGPEEPINVTDDFTRLTLDSIALCAMDKRFNSFYSNELHPFVHAMTEFLLEGGARSRRTALQKLFSGEADRRFQANIDLMKKTAKEVIDRRRTHPSDKKDLLNAMLNGKDPKTGEKMTEESIMNNMITFLIAGHETTSGLLSFTFYYMLKHPRVWMKAQQEVDSVVGKGPVKIAHLSKLPFLEAILRETLRLNPTAPGFSVKTKPGTTGPVIIGGQYEVPANASFNVLLPQVALDVNAFGVDADEFRPERMFGENFANLPPNAWKPFGNGARACIGRPFAWQEALLIMALILQYFDLQMEDPSYELQIKQTLTLKPDGFRFKASLREGIDPVNLEKKMYSEGENTAPSKTTEAKAIKSDAAGPKTVTILYGSNSGTCEGLAQSLAAGASTHGLTARVMPLDSATGKFQTEGSTIIITASYEGNPPDNATSFVEWMENAGPTTFNGARYAVFGCGHRDWVATYQRVPKLVDTELTKKGGKRILERGESNVADGTIFDDFDAWSDKIWPLLSDVEAKDTIEGLDMELSTTSRASHLRHSVQDALVLKNELLTAPGVPEKRQMDFKLPTSMTYEAGDYLALLPVNNVSTISRVLRRFGLPWDAMMKLRKGSHTTIPTDKEFPVTVVLGAYVELNGSATKKNIATLLKFGASEDKLAQSTGKSVLEMLEANPEIELPFAVYLSMLVPMRIRQYSISSSPLSDPTIATITFSVVEAEQHLGVATNYLRHLKPGTTVQLAIKKSHASFHLPRDDTTPVIMIGAGTGLAPFRGFVQERAAKVAAGKKLGEAALFIGCRNPAEDKLYAEQLALWQQAGVVKLYYAYSRASDQSNGAKYAQDRLAQEGEYVSQLFKNGARAYICGSAQLGKGVADAVAKMAMEGAAKKGEELSYDKASRWWESLRGERYAVDVFD